MKSLNRINYQAEQVAKKVEFKISYLPGISENLDRFQASNEILNIDSYGPTEEIARENAQKFATALLLEDSHLLKKIKNSQKK